MPRTTSVTNITGAILMIAAAAWLSLGAGAGAGAAPPAATYAPQPVKPVWQSAANRPEVIDPYKRLSGVIAVPPAEMMRPGSGGDPSWLGPLSPLVPPVFGPNVDASLNNPANQNETTVAIDPENDQHVIVSANDYRTNLKPWVYASSDGGTTFVNYQVPGTVSLFYGDPAMAFGRGGNAYFTYLGYQSICGGAGGMYASRSTDAGATFSAPIQLAANLNNGTIAVLQDKEYVAVDTNPASPYSATVYVGWTRYTFAAGANCGSFQSQISAPAVLSRSTDNGLTWSVPITASPPISDNNGGVVPAVGRQGEVYLYYIGAATQSQPYYDSVLVSRSTDGGLTFPHFTHISDLVDLPSPLPPTSFRNNPFGAIAADQVLDGYVYAVWADYRNGDADILLSRSTDSAATWSPPVRLNDDPVGNQKDQFFPWIASAPDGRIHVGWFDRREDPQNITYKEYYTSSTDHGATWEANIAVSSAPSNPGSSTFIGDYSGIAASDGVVIPTWTDIRTGANQNAYIARGVYSTTGVTVTPTPPATNTSTATATTEATATPSATATAPPCTNAWQTAAWIPTGVCCYAHAEVGNDIYIMGGNLVGGYSNRMYRYSAQFNVWTRLADVPVSANNAAAVALNGKIYFAGGFNNTYSTALYIYDISTNTWGVGAPMPSGLTASAAGAYEGKVYVAGGFPNTTALYIYDIAANSWSVGPALPQPYSYGGYVQEGSALYMVSGSTTQRIDFAGGGWSAGPSLPTPREHLALASDGSRLFAIGGDLGNGNFTNRVDELPLAQWPGGAWAASPAFLPVARAYLGAGYFTTGRSGGEIWATGGSEWVGDASAEHSYRPAGCPTATPTGTPGTCTVQFTDVPPTNTFYPFVRCLACKGIVHGYQCGGAGEPCDPSNNPYFRPNNYVTRGQLAKIVSESAGFNEQVPPSQWTFTDVPYGSTFWLWVERLSNRQVISGYQCGGPNEPCDNLNRPYFRPGNGATRGQLTKIVSNAAGFNDLIGQNRQTFADVPPNSTFWLYIERLLLNRPAVMSGYVCGSPTEPCDSENRPYFRPNNPLTRGQTAKIVANTFFPDCNPPARK